MLAKILSFLGLSGCATNPDVVPPVRQQQEQQKEEEARTGLAEESIGETTRVGIKDTGKDAKVETKKAETGKDATAVLFIGNSYSFGVPVALRKLAEKRGRDVRIGRAAHGGWTLARHMEHEPTLKKLRAGSWDYVVIQDFSLNPAKKEAVRRRKMDPGVRFFADQARSAGANPLLYQTWGRRDGDPGIPGDDFFKMNARVREGYRSAAERAGGVEIAPVGDVWEKEFRAGNDRKLFQPDGSHPSTFGNRVSARVFYDTIFGG